MTRVRMLAVAFTLGALAMSATVEDAAAQEKKRPSPTKDESYTEKVTVRRFVGGMLLPLRNAAPNIPAFRWEEKDELKFYTKAKGGATPTKGTEIIDAKGAVFVVEKVVELPGAGFHVSTVKLKPKSKD